MKYSQLLALLKKYQNDPNAWIRVDDEKHDGGNTSFCVEDVLLCIKFDVIWENAKPLMRVEFKYGTTTFSWFELPMPTATIPSHAELLEFMKDRIADL